MSNKKFALSSILTLVVLAISTLAIFISPSYFTSFPANFANLMYLASSLLIIVFFIITLFKRRHLYLNLSPLTETLFFFAGTIFISSAVNNFFYPEKSFLGLAGSLIAFVIISIFSSALIKIQNNKILIKIFLIAGSLISLGIITVFFNSFFNFLPNFLIVPFNSPLLNLSITLICIASLFALFFKKSKLGVSQLIFFPIIALGLVASLGLYFRAPKLEAPSFSNSLQVSFNQIVDNQQFDFKTFFWGSQAQEYSDIYQQFSKEQVTNLSFSQAFNLPLTLFTMFGIFPLCIWIILVVKTLILSLDRKENNNYLYFILFISFIVQFFTPTYIFILIIQAILIAFATNKNKKTLINLKLATILDHQDGQTQIEQNDKSSTFLYLIIIVLTLGAGFATLKLGQSYLGYFYHQKTLNSSQDLNRFYSTALKAVKIAPFIDTFNRYAAIANLEMMINSINNEQNQSEIETSLQLAQEAINYALKATDIAPKHAVNYSTLGAIYQEIGQYSDSQSRLTSDSRAVAAHANAILLQPNNPEVYLSLALFYQNRGEIDQALTIYQQALALNPNYLLTTYQLATLYEQQGDLVLALSNYQNALTLLDSLAANYQDNYQFLTQKIANLKAATKTDN